MMSVAALDINVTIIMKLKLCFSWQYFSHASFTNFSELLYMKWFNDIKQNNGVKILFPQYHPVVNVQNLNTNINKELLTAVVYCCLFVCSFLTCRDALLLKLGSLRIFREDCPWSQASNTWTRDFRGRRKLLQGLLRGMRHSKVDTIQSCLEHQMLSIVHPSCVPFPMECRNNDATVKHSWSLDSERDLPLFTLSRRGFPVTLHTEKK